MLFLRWLLALHPSAGLALHLEKNADAFFRN
jgi:hypothetical protein